MEMAISCTKCSHLHTNTHVHTLTTICLPNNSLCAERHQQQRCSHKSQHDGLAGAPCVLIGLCTELLQAMHGHSILRHRSPVAGPVVAGAAPRAGSRGGWGERPQGARKKFSVWAWDGTSHTIGYFNYIYRHRLFRLRNLV